MTTLASYDYDTMLNIALDRLYSAQGARVRVEWITETGGVAKSNWEFSTGTTETVNRDDTRAWILPLSRPDMKVLDADIVEYNPAMIWLDFNINLFNRQNFTLVHKIITGQYHKANGTGTSTTWTPDTTPDDWTGDQWIGYYLWFSDKRFKITDNSTTALTVTLAGKTLPATSTEGEIVGCQEWYPVFNKLAVDQALVQPHGEGMLLQKLLCTQIPYRGQES